MESYRQRQRSFSSFMPSSMMLMHYSRLACEFLSPLPRFLPLSVSLPFSFPPSFFLHPSLLPSPSLPPSLPPPLSPFSLVDYTASSCLCSRLSVLVKYHKLYAVNMKVICDLIRQIKEYRTMLSSTTAQDQWVRS